MGNATAGSCARSQIRFRLNPVVPDAVVQISLVCVECELVAYGDDAAGWRAYLTCDEPAEVGIYCPECAHREFERE
jgi:FPC/CPF motif-containing protein YcgG